MESITYKSSHEMKQYEVDYKDKILCINKFKFIELHKPPELKYTITDVTYRHANRDTGVLYYYILSGIIKDINLGIFISRPKQQNSIKSNTIIEGQFYDYIIRAMGNETHISRDIVHVIPGIITAGAIISSCTDLIPGVIGPLMATETITIDWDSDAHGNWSDELSKREVIQKYAPASTPTSKVNADDVFFVIADKLHLMKNLNDGVLVNSKMVHRYLVNSFYAYDQKKLAPLLTYPYHVAMSSLDDYRITSGLCIADVNDELDMVNISALEYDDEICEFV